MIGEGSPQQNIAKPETPDQKENESRRLAAHFRDLAVRGGETAVFEELERDLESEGFVIADMNTVFELLHDDTLLCRSESFGRVMELLLDHGDIDISNPGGRANMCRTASGAGFRIAMTEGFSGKDVEGIVKVVLTFEREHLTAYGPIARDSQLWELKPETAKVSLEGSGRISPEDVRMVSFRFPIRFYPGHLLSEDERERLEDERISFVVRHYVSAKKKTIH